jgi:thiosulfate/3-mercaptopyruvate sulfurtransferase
MYRTIVTTDELAALVPSAAVAVVDCRFRLDDSDWGRREYEAAHVPGAIYAHLEHDLSGHRTGLNGRHPLPDPAVLAQTLSRLGIGLHTQVVAYDQDAGAYAARLWWLLRWLGHDAVAVLDGGFSRWMREGRPTRPGEEQRAPTPFAGSTHRERVAETSDITRLISTRGTGAELLLDARAPERFRGEVEPIDRVAGHIPGARNYSYLWNIDGRGQFRPPEWIRSRVERELGAITGDQAVCYCGSGVTACHLILALEVAGLPGARLYPGSWSEWSADTNRPIETGPEGVTGRNTGTARGHGEGQ